MQSLQLNESTSKVAKIISVDMADVPKSLYRRYLEVSEATFQALLKNHSAGEVHHYKPILNFSSIHKGFEDVCHAIFCNIKVTIWFAIFVTLLHACHKGRGPHEKVRIAHSGN